MGPKSGLWRVLQANPLIFWAISGDLVPLATKWPAQGLDLLISGGFPQDPGFSPGLTGFSHSFAPRPPAQAGPLGIGLGRLIGA